MKQYRIRRSSSEWPNQAWVVEYRGLFGFWHGLHYAWDKEAAVKFLVEYTAPPTLLTTGGCRCGHC